MTNWNYRHYLTFLPFKTSRLPSEHLNCIYLVKENWRLNEKECLFYLAVNSLTDSFSFSLHLQLVISKCRAQSALLIFLYGIQLRAIKLWLVEYIIVAYVPICDPQGANMTGRVVWVFVQHAQIWYCLATAVFIFTGNVKLRDNSVEQQQTGGPWQTAASFPPRHNGNTPHSSACVIFQTGGWGFTNDLNILTSLSSKKCSQLQSVRCVLLLFVWQWTKIKTVN